MKYCIPYVVLSGLIAMPAYAAAPDNNIPKDDEALCREFAVKSIPDYAQGGMESIIQKNADKGGAHCMPMLPLPSKLTDEQFEKLRNQIYQSCLENVAKKREHFETMLKQIPEDCQ